MQKLKKKPKHPTAAQRALKAAEEAMLAKWANVPKFGRGTPPKQVTPASLVITGAPPREEPRARSLVTPGGDTALKPAHKYTGDACIGIATMHKSNAVPVFDSTAATEVSRMRR